MLVLETDEPHPETQDRKGSFGEIIHTLFNTAGSRHSPPLKAYTSMHYVVDDPQRNKHGHVPSLSQIPDSTTAILLTGSMYDAHGNDAWILSLLDLLRDLWRARPHIKFAGICFGHQLLSRLLGASVEPHPKGEWELAHTSMDLTPIGQRLFQTHDKQLALHQMHQDHVASVPSVDSAEGLLAEGAKVHVWASTGHTEVQGLYVRERLFTSQGHLGFDEEMVKRQIEMREESGGIKESREAEEGKERAHLRHDGEVVAGAILRFFHGDDIDVD
jgi:GMP synthase-like glutamine amidotransferase